MVKKELKPLVSIIILAFNNLDYTKLCVESLYKHTSNLNIELITVNNGSADGTAEFFNSLPNKKKINFSVNCGVEKAFNEGVKLAEGTFILFLSNDLVLTPHWLDNLVKCMQSDEKIGMVVPVCNSSSNSQMMELDYANIEELYQAAEKYNNSEPGKWEERLRLEAYTFITKTDLLKKLGGYDEIYSPYAFDDDDLSFRIRRAGYKLILARDTYIHHFGSATKRNSLIMDYMINKNRTIFLSRFGVDAWDDTDIDFEMLNLVDLNKTKNINILGIGFRCGGTILQAKNKFRENGAVNVRLWGFTQDEKYLADLNTICEQVICDRVENVFDAYRSLKFDCIMMDYDLRNIEDPKTFIIRIGDVLKEDGQLVITTANELFCPNIMNLLNGNTDCGNNAIVNRYIKPDRLMKEMEKHGYTQIKCNMQKTELPEEHKSLIDGLQSISQVENKVKLGELFCINRFVISAGSKKTVKKVLFYPGYDIWPNNMVFEDRNFVNALGIDAGENFTWFLREEFSKNGYEMSTIESSDDINDAEIIVFNDLPKHFGNHFYTGIYHTVYRGKMYFDEYLRKKAKGKTKARLIVRLDEPPCVMPENYDKNLHENLDMIFTYCDDLVDNKKYFKYFMPQPEKVDNIFVRKFTLKKLITFVGSNKHSDICSELYTERRKAIKYFGTNHIDDFDFYGKLWEKGEYPGYMGAIKNKLEILSQYKFCICYENCILNGWVSEKIFECFYARCIPVYLGAPNITDFIPADTFIDKREFGSYDHLYDFINNMSEEKYNEYVDNMESFLESDAYKKFTRSSFAQNLVNTILQKQKKSDHPLSGRS